MAREGIFTVACTAPSVLEPRARRVLANLALVYRTDDDGGCAEERATLVRGLRGDPSARVLNWLVTNFAMHYQIKYAIREGGGSAGEATIFDLYHQYTARLASHGRTLFDPFARNKKAYGVSFDDGDGGVVSTTVGQLNFMHWAIAHGVVEYARGALTHIQKHMASAQRRSKARRTRCADQGVTHRRRALSRPAGSGVFAYRVSVHLCLDGSSGLRKLSTLAAECVAPQPPLVRESKSGTEEAVHDDRACERL